ncbi:DUF4752 domain-containing protein [Citrobacter freundii complex sp. CFNIH2]|uniref:DUF4752 family protein n=1 Tax=Citrobacter freundii complex sp. CFNIH2 TaxID=2066049 RepID=UPI000C8692DF|nr:DUF4752 family protein [Citrobacter freundii complex sp. CFNIH2]AUO64080.1 DUF4752 domain-containing protein [Citrobacter freundii complex sp. CFNIH2]
MSIAAMMNTGLAVIGWLYIMFKAGEWFISIAFKQWVSRKKQEKRQKAVNEMYDAFNLSEIEPGGSVRLETKGDLIILMFRKESAQ